MPTIVEFRAADHKYILPSGRVLPGITELLRSVGMLYEIEDGPPLDPSKGIRVHHAVELYLQGNLLAKTVLQPDEEGYLEAAKGAVRELGLEACGVEIPLANEIMGYATKVDAVCFWRGKTACVNWKTSTKVYRFYAIQSALEALCFSPEPVERLGIHLQSDGKYRVQHYTDRNDFVIARSAATLAAWKKGGER